MLAILLHNCAGAQTPQQKAKENWTYMYTVQYVHDEKPVHWKVLC